MFLGAGMSQRTSRPKLLGSQRSFVGEMKDSAVSSRRIVGRKAVGNGGRRQACGMQGGGGPFEFVGQVFGTHGRAKSGDVESRAAASAHFRQIAKRQQKGFSCLQSWNEGHTLVTRKKS